MSTKKRSQVICVLENDKTTLEDELYKPGEPIGTDLNFKREIVWFPNVLFFTTIHVLGIYGYYLFLCKCTWGTSIFAYVLTNVLAFSVTSGAHRLYSHRTYKANSTVRFIILILFTIQGQNSMYRWVLDHRQHHKYSDTDADPHNASRGFFFSHIGWLMSRPHPAVQSKRRTIDMSDLDNDRMVMFQKKYYFYLYFILAFLLPIGVPMYFFNETFWNSFHVLYCGRYMISLNFTWSVNSLAHLWGTRPFDKNINPAENYLVSYVSMGEGWHNYHHAFPWDYKTSEHGKSIIFNPTTYVIELFARFGWVYDLKTTSEEMIRKKIDRTGDGTYHIDHNVKDPDN